jgi:hypothetical protein
MQSCMSRAAWEFGSLPPNDQNEASREYGTCMRYCLSTLYFICLQMDHIIKSYLWISNFQEKIN